VKARVSQHGLGQLNLAAQMADAGDLFVGLQVAKAQFVDRNLEAAGPQHMRQSRRLRRKTHLPQRCQVTAKQ
jgi:hypothetical protein